MYNMRDLNEYSVYIFDLDGTLYEQPRLRMIMACRLAGYYILHPFRIYDLYLVKQFRTMKEHWGEDNTDSQALEQLSDGVNTYSGILDKLDEVICSGLAKRYNIEKDRVCAAVGKWIYEEPLDALYKTRDSELISYIDELRNRGKKVIVLSDYPAVKKLEALKVTVDGVYSSTDPAIMELKPSPKGINKIISDLNIEKRDAVMIGDRQEKDGMAAVNAGIDYWILNRRLGKRKKEYKDNNVI